MEDVMLGGIIMKELRFGSKKVFRFVSYEGIIVIQTNRIINTSNFLQLRCETKAGSSCNSVANRLKKHESSSNRQGGGDGFREFGPC
jgi:hypothetical protein